MSIPLTDVVYPLDTSGVAASNRIPNERHELTTTTWDGFNLVIPKAAPFFDDSIEFLIHQPSGRRLNRGADWICGWTFESATGEIGQFVSSCVYILDTSLTGHVEIPSYQCLGGEWQLDVETLRAILAEKLLNPQRYYWEYVANLPQIFRPLDHDQDIDEFSELGLLLDGLRGIAQAITAASESGALGEHEAKRNPHRTRPIDLEGPLDKLMNWTIATLLEMQSPQALPTERYMTPPTTLALINNTVGAQLATFIARRDNPNRVTAEQAGATTEQQVRDLIDLYLSGGVGAGVNAATLEGYTRNQIIQDTLSQSGQALETKGDEILAEIRADLAGFQATDTVRFDGKTGGEWNVIINTMARTIAREESVVQFIPSLEDVLAIAEEPQDPAGPIIEFNTATLTERVKVVVAEYWPTSAQGAEAGAAMIIKVDGLLFYVVPSDSATDNGYVYSMGNKTLADSYTWFTTTDGAEGRYRLWVETPAARKPMSVLTVDNVGTTIETGYHYFGPSSATQYPQPGLKTAVRYHLTGADQITSQIATSATNVTNLLTQQINTLADRQQADLILVNGLSTIPANSAVEFNLTTLITTAGKQGQFDLSKAMVYVRAKNTDADSPNLNSWVNAEAITSFGLRANLTTAFVYNHTAAALDVFVRVSVPKS